MTATISHRATSLIAYSYDDFPATAGQLDLRGDNSAPLSDQFAHPIALPTAAAIAYGDIRGELRLRTVLADLFGVHSDQVVVTTGSSEALYLALTCITDHGDLIRIPRPAFPGFEQLARLLGLRVLPYVAVDEIPQRGTIPVLICTPHNPTGVVTDPQAAGRSGGWVLWDLSHMTPSGTGFAEFTARFDTEDIAVFSLSKLLRLPGARVGCLISRDPALLAAAVRAKTHLSMSTSCLAQDLALRVLRDSAAQQELRARAKLFTDHRAKLLTAVATSSAVKATTATDGTHIYIETLDGTDAWQRLAERGVVGIPGTVFNGTAQEVRLCIAQPQHVIDDAAKRVRSL